VVERHSLAVFLVEASQILQVHRPDAIASILRGVAPLQILVVDGVDDVVVAHVCIVEPFSQCQAFSVQPEQENCGGGWNDELRFPSSSADTSTCEAAGPSHSMNGV